MKLQNGVEQSESVENNLNVVELRENRNRNYSNTKRISYMEAVSHLFFYTVRIIHSVKSQCVYCSTENIFLRAKSFIHDIFLFLY